jgi:hypothetical protein
MLSVTMIRFRFEDCARPARRSVSTSFATPVYLAVAKAHLALRLFCFSFPFLEPLDKSGISRRRHPVAQRIANRHGRLGLLFSFADSTARQLANVRTANARKRTGSA